MEGSTTQQLQEKAREVQAKVGPQIEEARRSITRINDQVLTFVRERPGTCLLGALAFGFVVGKIANRR